MASNLILTIGHSTHPLAEFTGLLKQHAVSCIVDVRSIPRSRHNPQFNRETLPTALAVDGIGYRHMASLGGLRHPLASSLNTAWTNASFRGFADYMQAPQFTEGLLELLELAKSQRCALMCGEAVPWRCHRSLIADTLVARGLRVLHILGETKLLPHMLRAWAHVDGTAVTYPAAG